MGRGQQQRIAPTLGVDRHELRQQGQVECADLGVQDIGVEATPNGADDRAGTIPRPIRAEVRARVEQELDLGARRLQTR